MPILSSTAIGGHPVSDAIPVMLPHDLIIGPVDYAFANDDTVVYITGTLVPDPAGVSYAFENDDVTITQEQTLEPSDVVFAFEIADVSLVSQQHLLTGSDVVYAYAIDDVASVIQTHTLSAAAMAMAYAVPDATVVQTHALDAPSITYTFANDDNTVTQTHELDVEDSDFAFSVDYTWVATDRNCLDYASDRVLDEGMKFQANPQGAFSAHTTYERLYYVFTLRWILADATQVRSIQGFHEAHRHCEFMYTWPGDNDDYVCSVMDFPMTKQTDEAGNWDLSIQLRGYLWQPGDPVPAKEFTL